MKKICYKFPEEGFRKSFNTKEEALDFIKDKIPCNGEYFNLEKNIITNEKINTTIKPIVDYKLVKKLFEQLQSNLDIVEFGGFLELTPNNPYDGFTYEYNTWQSEMDKSYINKLLTKLISNIEQVKVSKISTNYTPCNNICFHIFDKTYDLFIQFRKNDIIIDDYCYTGRNVKLRTKKPCDFTKSEYDELIKLFTKI